VTSRAFRFRSPREIAPLAHSYAATREAAITAFAKSWRREQGAHEQVART
jgi:hypothetical protein